MKRTQLVIICAGPAGLELGIAMDISIIMKTPTGKIVQSITS